MPSNEPGPFDELLTLKDWLRYAVSSFTKAKLVYGHGTANAVDEAAFLILSTLNLPIDNLEPWLDCRLTLPERQRLHQIIGARVATRKPASYLTHSAWIQGYKFYVDERVIVPRSYIGELLCNDGLSTAVADAEGVTSVLELCTGSGCLAILAALAFPRAHVTAIDISGDALEVAKRNVADYELGSRVDAKTIRPLRTYRRAPLRSHFGEPSLRNVRRRRSLPARIPGRTRTRASWRA